MANEVITRVSVDASGFEAGMERVGRASKGFVSAQETSARKYDACQKEMAASGATTARALEEAVSKGSAATARQVSAAVRSFEKMADAAGKTRVDLMRLKAAKLGIAEAVEPLIGKVEAASRAMHHLGTGSSAARRELFVLGHEAMQGRWKNFVGSLMVLGECMDVLPLLCGPAGIALGALGASAYVAYHAIQGLTEQQKELDRAIVLTGNYAALTQGKLLAYSETISRHLGVSANDARQALRKLALSGHVAGADLSLVSESVAAYAKVSGQSVEDTVRQFEQSYGHAAEAARKWSESHHDLTRAQIEQIRAMEQAGDKAGAWAKFVATASAEARKSITSDNHAMAESYESLGERWERFWRSITGKGDELTKLQDGIASKRAMLYDADANPFGMNTEAIEKEITVLERRKKVMLDQASRSDEHKKSVDTFASMMARHDEELKSARSWKEKLDDANASARAARDSILEVARAAGKSHEELRALGQRLDADLKKTIAHNEDVYRPRRGAAGVPKVDAGSRYLEHVREQGAALEAQSRATDKLTNAQKELAQFNEKIAAAKRHIGNADEASLVRSEKAIRSSLEHNTALEKGIRLREARAKLLERMPRMDEYQQSQKERYTRALDERRSGGGIDPLSRDERADITKIVHDYQRALDKLKRVTPSELLGSEEYRRAVEQIKAQLDESTALHTEHFGTLEHLRDDWAAGLRNGMADFYKDTFDKADFARRAMTDAMSGMEGAIEKFVSSGKRGMKKFVASALADLSRLSMHQALGSLIGSLLQSSPTTGLIGQILKFLPHHARGGTISGPGTGTSDSVPAMLSNGEYVVNAASARQHHALLEAINLNHVAHFASGGPVGATPLSASQIGGAQIHMEIHNHGGGGLSDHDVRELKEVVSAFVDQKISRRMGGQGGVGYLMSQGHLA
ncbi:phage tail length tape measure family protein [Caballeronia sp. LZ035]|uniref:phage tail length tape measure family protein n=1 Tax=Caballeronia sp. LZ035 TaxID=3038568 RepID=UPI00285A7FDF|nr:phage tail length tape measure family protein [Caballeronia sp. LZ035]MDR5756505.1 phage tail length tape measure family protein [Caballeronia sp. LZ035]